MQPSFVFFLGLLGAAAPEILRLYSLRTKPKQFRWSWSYLGLTVPFLLLGGLVALILPAVTPWGAFYTGLSTPVLISSALKLSFRQPQAGEGPQAFADVRLSGIRAFVNGLGI
jgi:hypothetical protein